MVDLYAMVTPLSHMLCQRMIYIKAVVFLNRIRNLRQRYDTAKLIEMMKNLTCGHL